MVHLAADFDSQLPDEEDYDDGHKLSDSELGSDHTEPEPEHQEHRELGQDSIKSRIEDTQFEPLEIDTQASELTNFCIPRKPDLIPPSSQMAFEGTSFFQRPFVDDDDPAAGFAFGQFIKPTVNQFTSRPKPGGATAPSTSPGSCEGAAQTQQSESTRISRIDTIQNQKPTTYQGNPPSVTQIMKLAGVTASVAIDIGDVTQSCRTESASNSAHDHPQRHILAPQQDAVAPPIFQPDIVVPLNTPADKSINSHADAAPIDTSTKLHQGLTFPPKAGANTSLTQAQTQLRLQTGSQDPLGLNSSDYASLDLAPIAQPSHAAPHTNTTEETFHATSQLRALTAPTHAKQVNVSRSRSRSYGRINHKVAASETGRLRTPNSVLRRPFPEVQHEQTSPRPAVEVPPNYPQPTAVANLELCKDNQQPAPHGTLLEHPLEHPDSALNDNANALPKSLHKPAVSGRPSCPTNVASFHLASSKISVVQSVSEQQSTPVQEGINHVRKNLTSDLVQVEDASFVTENTEVPLNRQPRPAIPDTVDTHHFSRGQSESPFRPSSAASGQSVASRPNISAPMTRPANTTVHDAGDRIQSSLSNTACEVPSLLQRTSRAGSTQQYRQGSRAGTPASMGRRTNTEFQHSCASDSFQTQVLRTTHATRIAKPDQNRGTHTNSAKSQQANYTEASWSKMSENLTTQVLRTQQIWMEYNSMLEKSNSQDAEIEDLKMKATDSTKRIEGLVAEKAVRDRQIQKFRKVCEAYKEHMNKVVSAQKALMSDRNTIREEVAEAAKQCTKVKEVQKEVEQMKQKRSEFLGSVGELKKIRECVTKDVEMEKSLHSARQEAKTLAEKAEDSAKQARDSEKKAEESGRKEEETAKKLAEVSFENQRLWTQLRDAHKNSEGLQKDCDRFLNHLQSEQGNCQRLDKQLSEQMRIHKDLVILLKKIPKDVIVEFSKDDGFLSKMMAAEQTTHAKIDDIAKLINHLENLETKPSPSLVKLIEDLSERILQTSLPDENAENTRQQFISKLFDELKTWLDQFCSDSQTQLRLNTQISELQQYNAALTANNSSSELEKKNLSKQVQEAKQERNDVRSKLEAKSHEVEALQALPKEDPRLDAKIKDLEDTNSSLQGKLQSTRQNVTRLQEEVQQFQEEKITSQGRISRFEKDKQEMRAAFAIEKQKDAELAEQNKTQNNVYYETTIMNQRQVIEDNAVELESRSAKLETALVELELLKNNSAKSNLDHEEFFDIAQIGRTLVTKLLNEKHIAEVHVAGESISKCLKSIESIGEKVRTTVDAQIGVTNSIKRYEEENITLLKRVHDLQTKANMPSELQARNHYSSLLSKESDSLDQGVGEDDAILRDSLSFSNGLLSKTSMKKQTHATLQEVSIENQYTNQSVINDDAPARRVPAPSPSRPACRISQRISASAMANQVLDEPITNSRTIPDSQEQEDVQAFSSVVEQTATIKLVAPSHRHLLPSSPSVDHTPAFEPFASAHSSQSSVGSIMTDLDDFDFARMTSTDVTQEYEKRSHEKHGRSTRPVQSTTHSSTQNRGTLHERNAPISGQFSEREASQLVSEPKNVQNQEIQPAGRKMPGHRQVSVLKSAMKSGAKLASVEQVDTPKDSKARQTQSRPANASVPGAPAGRASSKASAVTPRHYNRVAASQASGNAGAAAPAVSHPAKKGRTGLSLTSLVPNATRRNSGFSGFDNVAKRPADAHISASKPSKAPRNFWSQESPAESVKLKPRISLPPTRLQPGVRR